MLEYAQICPFMLKYALHDGIWPLICPNMLKYAETYPNMLKYTEICRYMLHLFEDDLWYANPVDRLESVSSKDTYILCIWSAVCKGSLFPPKWMNFEKNSKRPMTLPPSPSFAFSGIVPQQNLSFMWIFVCQDHSKAQKWNGDIWSIWSLLRCLDLGFSRSSPAYFNM